MGGETLTALNRVNLTIERGEFVAVMGPSGSGKSTFLNQIGCLDTPTSGTVLIDGQATDQLDAAALAALRNRYLGFVFQQFNLLARTSAIENVMLPLLYSPTPRAKHRAIAMERLRAVGLAERASHHPSQLSGGQQQRVAIARALVNEPKILLADEPTGALDSRTSLEIMSIFEDLSQQGITILLVTHEADIAAHAERTLFFRDGRIQEDRRQRPVSARDALATAQAALGVAAQPAAPVSNPAHSA
ncbi:MAG: ABC transporter ATP-binding protein [Gammaproteobacteria bacterium]|nr:ABC transporter ATP-binding protein [Gammaproteobacteria bacterium]